MTWYHCLKYGHNLFHSPKIRLILQHFCQKSFPNVPAGCELVLGGGFVCTEQTSSSSREKVIALTCDHEEADIRIILHSLEATKRGYDHIMVFCRDTDVLLLLLHFFDGADHMWIWEEKLLEMFIQHPLLLDGVGRDGPLSQLKKSSATCT